MIANIKLYEELSEVLGKEKAERFIEALIIEIKEVVKQEKPETIKEIKSELKEELKSELATKEDIYKLDIKIEELRTELKVEIEKSKSETIKWVLGISFAQLTIILGVMIKLLS